MSNKLLATLLLVLTFIGIAYSGIITRPTKTTGGTSYTDGTVPHASDFNGDIDTVYTLVNGNIEDANVKAGAAISASKITPNFANNIQVTTAAAPCFVNINSALGANLKQWRLCQDGSGVLSIGTYTDAGALIITPLSIARATGQVTLTSDLILTAGAIQVNALTAKSFMYTGVSGLISTTAAPTNGQLLIGNTGNAPSVDTLRGVATHTCVTSGAGTITVDFCSNPAIASPVFSGTATGTYTLGGTPTITAPSISSPVLSGTATGTYTLGGTPTITAPVLSGTITGTYTLGGNPTFPSDMTLATMQAASGTSVDFTSIPSTVKRIVIMFSGVSTNGTSQPLIQIGDSGGIENTGYLGSSVAVQDVTASAGSTATTGFIVLSQVAANVLHGAITLTLMNAATNLWTANGVVGFSNVNAALIVGGAKATSATLDRVRITTINGTDAFDAGNINILYE